VNILDFCERHQIHLISDEIYACSVFDSGEDAVPFTSILSIPVDRHIDPSRLHVIYGLSKDFGAAGLRIGAVITRSKSLLAAVDAVTRFSSASGPSLAFGKLLLADRDWVHSFVDRNKATLAAAYKHVTTALKEIGVKYIRGGNAGFFVYIDLSPFLPDHRVPEFELADRLQKAGLFLHPCEEHAPEPGWFRLVFTQDPRGVTEGIKR
jgi:1-aminocyclopropane-1-carboxylate synthase